MLDRYAKSATAHGLPTRNWRRRSYPQYHVSPLITPHMDQARDKGVTMVHAIAHNASNAQKSRVRSKSIAHDAAASHNIEVYENRWKCCPCFSSVLLALVVRRRSRYTIVRLPTQHYLQWRRMDDQLGWELNSRSSFSRVEA